MNLPRTFAFASLALVLTAPVWAASPSSGDLTDTGGPLSFTGGPFVVPNMSTLTYQEGGPLLCDATLAQALVCDLYTLNVSIPDTFRKDDKNKKQVVQIIINYSAPAAPADSQVDFDVFIFDASGAEIARGISNGGVPETITLPLSTLKDGSYTIKIIPAVPLGASITGDIHLGRAGKDAEIAAIEVKSGEGLLLGAFGLPALLSLFGLAVLKRRPKI